MFTWKCRICGTQHPEGTATCDAGCGDTVLPFDLDQKKYVSVAEVHLQRAASEIKHSRKVAEPPAARPHPPAWEHPPDGPSPSLSPEGISGIAARVLGALAALFLGGTLLYGAFSIMRSGVSWVRSVINPTESRTATTADEAVGQALDAVGPPVDAPRLAAALARLGQFGGTASPRRANRSARKSNAVGLAHIREKRYTDAARAFEAGHRSDPTDQEIANNLGFALLQIGKLEAAEEALTQALALAPRRVPAWANLGTVLARRGRQRQAVSSFLLAYRLSSEPLMTSRFLQGLALDASLPLSERRAAAAAFGNMDKVREK